MRFPAVFVNHGGGPLPLLGAQPNLAQHMKDVVSKYIPETPKAIVVISAHFEADPISITSAENPEMLFDYSGFPAETYEYKYPAKGHPELACRIQNLLSDKGIESKLENKRGFDHGVFVPLILMYPAADIPVVCVSLHTSLAAKTHLELGRALKPLRDEGVLLLGSGYTYHNLRAMLSQGHRGNSLRESQEFNNWLEDVVVHNPSKLTNWTEAPFARKAHPREEHLLPLFVAAASAEKAELIYSQDISSGDHAVSGYLFS